MKIVIEYIYIPYIYIRPPARLYVRTHVRTRAYEIGCRYSIRTTLLTGKPVGYIFGAPAM